MPEQVAALADIFDLLERELGLFGGRAQDGADDRDHAGDHQRPRRLESAAAPGGRARSLHRRAFRHIRLHGQLPDHGRAPAHDAPRLRLRAPHDAGRLRRHGPLALRRRDQHHARRAAPRGRGRAAHARTDRGEPRDRSPRLAAALRPHPALADERLSTRAGICTRRSCRRATRPSTPSSSTASRRRPSACRTSSRRPPRPRSSATCSTTRRPARGSQLLPARHQLRGAHGGGGAQALAA